MRLLTPADRALALGRGETPVAVQPRLVGRVDAGDARRMNAFAGRALTAPLLTAEQNHRGRRIALLQQALSAGVVDGLGLAFDAAAIQPVGSANAPLPDDPAERAALLALATPRWLTLEAGLALAASGEEVAVPQPLRLDALALPVLAPDWLLSGQPPPPRPPQADGTVLESRRVGAALREAIAAGHAVPRVGVVLLQPVEHWQVDGADPFDQCERDLDAEAFEDQLRQDAGRLLYYPWPDEWLALPAPDGAWRNRLAHQLFQREAWLGSAQAMPWHGVGIPLALVAFDTAWQPLFADRGAVVRAGARPRTPPRPGPVPAGDRFLWQARIEQLAEHLAEARAAGADTPALGAQLRLLPPAGLLPVDALDVRARLNRFFPPTLDVFAAPVPLEQLDLLLQEAAGLAPIDLSVRERVGVYVPVPQAVYEPDLLVVEQADPGGEIGRTLARFVDARGDWLRRRQQLRGQQFVHRQGLEGAGVAAPPQPADDPLRLEDETVAAAVPAPAGLLHRSALAEGMHQHVLEGVADALRPQAADTLYAWVLVDREHPPRQLMLQFNVDGWEHRAYWGANLLAWGADGSAARLRQGEALPEAGVWTRLQVKAADLDLAGRAVTGMAFTLVGGCACWGPAGLLRGAEELPWLSAERLAQGRTWGDGEGWDLVAEPDRDAPFEAALGTRVVDGVRQSTAVAELLADPDIATLKLADDAATRDKAPTLAQLLVRQGLRRTVAALAARVDEGDDAINLGYLRVQTDLYRLRQTVLKQSQATRFAVSPALTQIADLDNASATGEQLAGFYRDVKADAALIKREGSPPVFGVQLRDGVAGGIAAAAATRAGGVNAALSSANVAAGAGTRLGSSGALNVNLGAALDASLNANLLAAALDTAALRERNLLGAAVAATPGTVTGADALTGKAEIRTSSIAARMERPRSVEAKDFTVATRHEVVGKLAGLALDLDALPLTGLASLAPAGGNDGGAQVSFDPAGQPRRVHERTLGALRALAFVDVRSDPDPQDDKADESAFFLGGVDLSDHTIALLRRAEGQVRRYRDALARCRAALAATEAALGQVEARLGVLARELAEARQDVATARALLAEEVERARALNARRDAVIAAHVQCLAYARVRVVQRAAALALPTRALDASQEPDAVPACLAGHGDPPADVAAMLAVVRRAPVAWFPAMRAQLALIDHVALADRFIATLQPRLAAAAAPAPAAAAPAGLQLQQQALRVTSLAVSQAQSVSLQQVKVQALPQLQAALLPNVSLTSKVELIGRTAALQDLLEGVAERSALQQRAAQEIERIGAVAGCLHARLSAVRPALRLVWAEQFSQFDAARGQLDLGDLSTLPRLGELPREDREDITELARWLRGRADRTIPAAVALLADLVRVCLLAASHSPTGEIIGGRIVRPLPLNPGIHLDIRPLLPERVRLGMAVRLFDAGQLAAQAVVTDLVDGVAAVRVTQTVTAGFLPTLATAVQFVAN